MKPAIKSPLKAPLKTIVLGLAAIGVLSSATSPRLEAAPRVADTITMSQGSNLEHPVPIVTGSDGSIFVGGYYSGTLVKIDPATRQVVAQAGGMRYPIDIRLYDNKVYVSALDSGNQAQIMVYDLNLNFVKSIASQNGWIHSFVIDSDAGKLYYGTWGKLHVIHLSDDTQRQLIDFGNWVYAVSSMNLDADRAKLYLTVYDNDQATAEYASFDLGSETLGARVPIGKNPVGVDSRYDSDRDGDFLFITQMYSSSITVVNVSNDSIDRHIANVSWPQRMIADRGRHKLYVVDNYSDKLHILNTQTLALEQSMTPGDDPSGVAFDASRGRIYTANVWSQDVTIVDYNTYALLERIPFAPATPLDGEIDGGSLYLTNGPNGGIYKIDADNHKVLEKINFYDYMLMSGLFNFPAGYLNLYGGEMEMAPIGGDRRAYAIDEFNQGIAEYNLTTKRYIGNIHPDGAPSSLAVHDGKLYFPYVSNSNLYLGIHDGSAITSKLIGPSDGARGIKIHPSNGKAYIADYSNHQVVVYDVRSFQVLKRINVGQYPAHLVIDATSNLIFVANYDGDSVTVIDGDGDAVKTTIAVGGSPWGLGLNAAKKRLYVVNTDDNTLSIIDTRTFEVKATLPVSAGAKFCVVDAARHKVFVPGQTGKSVTVIEDDADILAPSFECPSSIVKENVESDSVAVTFATPQVTDDMDPSPTISLSPASGSSFPVGITTVTVTAQDASGNIARCYFTVTIRKKICPRNVGDLAANPIPGRKIEISWSPSITPGIKEYRIYMGEGSVNYSAPAAVVAANQLGWTAANLQAGITYKFVVRAVHTGGCEEQNTNVVTGTAYNTPPCLSATIKNPRNGQKVSGERLTVMAETRCADSNDVKSIRFEYRPASGSDWTLIPAANNQHPNPDDKFPYFVHWDVDNLANGEYHIRAVAVGTGNEDSSPAYVTIVVDHADPDCEERRDDNGKVEKIERVENQKKNTVVISDEKLSCPAEVQIPAGCLAGDETKVTVKLNPDHPKSDRLVAAGTSIEIELHSGQSALGGEAVLTLPYPDKDNDGIVDGTRIREKDLAVFYYNPAHRKWEKMKGDVNTKNKTVIAKTNHFSLFALFDAQSAADAAFVLGEAYAYPNPARGGKNPILHFEAGIADDVTMRIYDASGELVHTIQMGNSPAVVNDKFAYEAPWDVSSIASGIYVVNVTARKDNNTIRKNFKLAVVK